MNHGGQHPAIRQLLANIIGENDALLWSRTNLDPVTGEEWPPTRPNEPKPPPPPSDGGKPTANPTAAYSQRHGERVKIPDALLRAVLEGQPSEADLATQGQGSNWWALGAARTSTQGPLLANDPHLGVSHAQDSILANSAWVGGFRRVSSRFVLRDCLLFAPSAILSWRAGQRALHLV